MVVYKKRELLKHMPDVSKYDASISSLNEKWENLKLLCEINCPTHSQNILPAMGEIQSGFSDLQQKLIETLISETMNKMEQKNVSKAQVAIDILIRNLYERTADVGFLSTDGDIRRFARSECRGVQEQKAIVHRLREYVAKYSVYEEIIILDTKGRVLANLDEKNPIAGKILDDPILDCTLQTDEGFVESFQPSALQPTKQNAHIFSHKIMEETTGEVLGVLCLCFRFDNEMKTIFKKLCTDYDGSIIAILDSENKVLASSDDAHVAPGTTVEAFDGEAYGVVYYRGQEYIVRTVPTQGYQNYYGLGWKGHIMIPVRLAFQEKAVLSGVNKSTLDSLMSKADSFSPELNEIIKQTQTITRSLKWIVCNGQIIARNVDTNDESYRLKPILNAIEKVGVQTGALFQSSVHNLFATLISTDLVDVRFMASLCVDIMDRNLYERADDCRWWALNPTFRELLAGPAPLSKDTRDKLTGILSHIHSLYTVYSNLFLFDDSGTVVAVSNPGYRTFLGKRLGEAYIQNVLNNCDAGKYYVSPFEATELYGGKHTYIYGASITDRKDPGRTVGGVGIVFDSTDQFCAMLEDGIHKKQDCFAVFTDRHGTIISSTDSDLAVGTRIQVSPFMLQIQNGQSNSEILPYNGGYYAIGCACSSSYREYKNTDGYNNDVLAFVFEKLADYSEAQQNDVSRITIEQSDIVLSANEKHKMLVTFVVNDQLFGIDQDFVMEVVGSEKAFFFHGASGKIRMAVPYKERYLAAINLRALFNQAVPSLGNPYLLVIGRQDDLQVALEVDDLNSVLEVNASDIKEAPNISELQSCFSGVACFQSKAGNRFLFVLNHDALLSRKELEGIMGQLDKIKETVSQIDAPQQTAGSEIPEAAG